MCGIVGFVNYKYDREKNITAMKDRMAHRGPDSEGTYLSPDGMVTLGHRRLAIVDITDTGHQPMFSHNGRYVTVFNGEIYNHRQIRKQLLEDKSLGINEGAFKGTSDTEVMLEAVNAYGFEGAISKLKGMFGVAVYDTEEKILYLARDRMGEKPLYYGRVGEAFVFSSDIGSISVLEGFDNPVDRDVLDIYFVNGYIPAPYSIYKGIYKLEPGCILKIKAPFDMSCAPVVQSYWDIRKVAQRGEANRFKGSLKEAGDELERLLLNAIRDQMTADVPVGAFLSAGIDSPTTVALMQSLNTTRVKSFTIGMDDPEYNEAVYAKEIAAHLGTEHTELYISEKDAKASIPKFPYMFGEPFADSSQIPTYMVSKLTREHVTVSLSGDGGDELFYGYAYYNAVDAAWKKIRPIPYLLRKPISSIVNHTPLVKNESIRIRSALLKAKNIEQVYVLSRDNDRKIHDISLSPKGYSSNNETIEPDFLGKTNKNLMLMDSIMFLPDDILAKVDRTAMAVSLETRVPLLDYEVVEFAWTLPMEYLVEKNVGKQVLREVLYRYVPKELMERPKRGFCIPINDWLRNDPGLREWAEGLLNEELIKSQGYLNEKVVRSMWNDLLERNIWRPQIWYILMFQAWLEGCNKKVEF